MAEIRVPEHVERYYKKDSGTLLMHVLQRPLKAI
jgi:hypothetical protein